MPNPRVRRTPDHPDFPHGGLTGYAYGCHQGDPCPTSPTCAEAKAQHGAEYRTRTHGEPEEGRITTYVSRRLAATLQRVTVAELAEETGIPVERLQQIADRAPEVGVRLPEEDAAPLDIAWARLVHGKDATTVEHGTERAYREGLCRCAPCTAASTRVRKRVAAGHKVALSNEPVTPALRAHTQRLTAAAGTMVELSRIVGVHWHTIRTIIEGDRAATTAQVAHALRSLTPAGVAAESTADPLIDADEAHRLVCSLHALGYPLNWIGDQIRAQEGAHFSARFRSQKYVRASSARAVRALVDRIKGQRARPEDGIDQQTITRMTRLAERSGWYPPACYDDDGTLVVRAIHGHPFSQLDERADQYLNAAHMVVHGHSQAEAAATVGMNEKTIQRRMKPLGLTYDQQLHLDPIASTEVIRRVSTVYADYTAGDLGPVESVLMLNLLDLANTAQDLGRVILGHPEVVAWLARDGQSEVAA